MIDYNLKCIYEQMQRQSINLSKYKGPSKEQKLQKRINAFKQQMANYKTGDITVPVLPDGATDLTWANLPEVVYGAFWCSDLGLTSLKGGPVKVQNSYYCYSNKLTSLQGGPVEVGKFFSCINNELTNLKGAPTKVGLDFFCAHNKLTSLEGAPTEVNGDFNCKNNKLTNLKGGPVKVNGNFYCKDNPLTSLEGAPKILGQKAMGAIIKKFISDVFSHDDYINFINNSINTENKS